MAIEFRKTGISVVGDVPWGTHFCHFYETKQDLLDTLVPYFKAGLESKEFCLWVVSNSDLITIEEAKRALEQVVPDLDRHLSNENIEILNGTDWYLEENAFHLEKVTSAWDAKLKRALARGYDGMRVSGDTLWLAEKDWKDFFAYEKQINEFITDRPMTLLCTYPLAKSGAAEVLDVVQAHQFAIARRQGEWEVIQTSELIQAKAEIKRLNEALQRVKEGTSRPPVILRYGVAVLSVTAALIIALWMESVLQSAPHVSLFLCAVMLSAWFGGIRPGLLAIALSLLAFAYILPPNYSLTVETREVPRLLIFALSALFVGSLSAAQRNKAESLRRARDVLDETGQELKRANEALRTENAERKHAETLLHAKEQEFRAIVENAPDQIIRYDRNFRRAYVNPAVARAYGLPREALIGKPIGSVIEDAGLDVKEDELTQLRQRIAAVFETGKSYQYEMTWPLPIGRRYFSVRLFPELDLNGSVINVLGISRDITERKQAEDALRRSEDHLRLIIDTIPMMAWSVRPDGTVDFLNQRWMDYTGLSLERYVEEPTRPIHPEDVPSVIEKWLANIAVGEPYEAEMRLQGADGEYRWFLVRTAPLRDEQGNLVKWYGVSIDIEDRKHAEALLYAKEQEFRAIVENAPDHIARYDREFRRTYANPALAKAYDLPAETLIGKPMFSIIRDAGLEVKEEELAQIRQRFEAVFDTGKSDEFEITLPMPPGRRDYSVRIFPEFDLNGSVINVLSIARDITESKRAEEQLRATSDQLRALSARLSSAREEESIRIAREIHDELGSMLTTLKWDLEEIQMTLSTPVDRSQPVAVREKLQALIKLTDMSVSTLRRIASELRPSVLDDLGLAAAIEWQAQQFQTRTGIICNCDCSLDLTELSEEQSTAVFRIFQEALTNVLRHARATRVDIKIKKENGHFALSIRDNGKGISQSERSEQKSLGILGMRERAHLIGGEVSITGAEGQGAVVTVRVPIAGRDVVRRMTR